MSDLLHKVNILISCPTEMDDYVEIAERACEQFNKNYGDILNIELNVMHWSRNTFSSMGDQPQSIINSQIVDKCDVAIGLMWKHAGTPTEKYSSGTQEEIELMIDRKKQAFMYFCKKDEDQITNEVKSFQDWCKNNGLYKEFIDVEEFEYLLYQDIKNYFIYITKRNLSISKGNEESSGIKISNLSDVIVNSIIHMNKFCVDLSDTITNAVLHHDPNYSTEIEKIHEKRYKEICDVYNEARVYYKTHSFMFPKHICDKYEKILQLCAEELNSLIWKNKNIEYEYRMTDKTDINRMQEMNKFVDEFRGFFYDN